jgi:flagellar assembly protein FliH
MSAFVPLLHHFVPPRPEPEPEAIPAEPAPPPIDLERERASAWQEGYAAAERTLAVRIAELEARLAATVPAVEEVARARAVALDRAADDVAALVVAVARRVVGDSLALHPDALPGAVRSALAELPDEDEVWIRVPPEAVERVRPQLPERYRSAVVAAPEVAAGCVVETRHASIDATLAAAVEGVGAATAAWLAGRK